jgi:hypothetical protein
MAEEESGLFQVKFTEQGKKFISRFAALSYAMLVLVLFGYGTVIYLNIQTLITRTSEPGVPGPLYNEIFPYLYIFFSVLGIIANVYYLRFPRVLLRSIKINDEWGANNAFNLLFKGALFFLVYLLLNTGFLIWTIIRVS